MPRFAAVDDGVGTFRLATIRGWWRMGGAGEIRDRVKWREERALPGRMFRDNFRRRSGLKGRSGGQSGARR